KTPVDRIVELSEITPLAEAVEPTFDETKERIRHHEWRVGRLLVEHRRRGLELATPIGDASSNAQ
ncbi:TPA: IS481 family transposase, partial [Pseudomonas aeruginosa]